MREEVIIIGSGLGGLMCGAILSKEGYRVHVLEKNHQTGGNLQTFEREGHRFETGLHYIGSMDKGQTLYQFFKYAGLTDQLKLQRLEMKGYDRMTFGDEATVYHHDQEWDNFREGLVSQFPGEKDAIHAYVEKVTQTIQSIPLYNLENATGYRVPADQIQGCAMGVIASLTRNTRLQSILAGANSTYHGAAHRTPWYLHCCVRNSLVRSSWRPAEGSHQISDALVEVIEENGGSVSTNSEVVKINVSDGRVTGVLMNDGQVHHGNIFISNAHPATTLQWLAPELVRKVSFDRIARLENTPGFFSVYMVMKDNSLPYQNYNHFHYRSDKYFNDEVPDSTWPQTFLLYTPAHAENAGYASIASAMTFMPFNQFSPWAGMPPEDRGQEYQDFKKERAEKLLEALEVRYPGIKGNIESYYVSTPLTFQDYTGTKDGSAYGILKDCRNPLMSMVSHRTRIPNLFFTGQNLNIHGVLGTTIGAILTSSEMIGFQEIIKKILRA